MISAGIDEAGRGCVLGPLVLAVCVIDDSLKDFFKKQGVTDSKLLSIKKRNELFCLIKEKALDYKIGIVSAQELNIIMNKHSLNEIEAIKAVEIVKALNTKFDKLILDSPDTDPERFKRRFMHNINIKPDYDIISEHKADLKYTSVSCASILAKVTRDNLIHSLTNETISGYSSDPKTIEFIKKYLLENKKFPDCTRTKWKTVDNILNDMYQKKIGWFCGSKQK